MASCLPLVPVVVAMPSRKPSKRSGDEDVEHEPPFKFRRSVHFVDCKRDELMLTESERGQLQKVLATHDVALALVETDDESLESEDDKKDKKSMLKSKLGNTRGSRPKEPKADLLRKLKPGKGLSPVATTRESKREKEKEKLEKEMAELEKLVDGLGKKKLKTLVEMWGLEVGENGEYDFAFSELSKKERVRFRASVEQLLAEGPKEKKPEKKEKKAHTKEKKPQKKEDRTHTKTGIPKSEPEGSQKAKSKDAQPAKPAKPQVPEAAPAAPEAPCSSSQRTEQEEQEPERELTVEEMLAEFELWI